LRSSAKRRDNLRFALNTGHAALTNESIDELITAAGSTLGAVLICAPQRDLFDQTYDAHSPAAGSGLDLSALTRLPDTILQILDAVYPNHDAEYLDGLAAWERPSGA